jgi:hypothetical protein
MVFPPHSRKPKNWKMTKPVASKRMLASNLSAAKMKLKCKGRKREELSMFPQPRILATQRLSKKVSPKSTLV